MSGLGEGIPQTPRAIWARALAVWAGLAGLLGATLAGAWLPLGRFNLLLALAIAAAKAALVVVFYMQLRRPDPLLRLAATASLVFMAFLFTLSFADLLTRPPLAQPGNVTPQTSGPGPVTGRRAF